MKELTNKIAVITGAASSIGKAIAACLGSEGVQVVLADVEQTPLEETASELESRSITVLPVRSDVSKPQDIERILQMTLNTFGAVHILCDNVGVVGPTPRGALWETLRRIGNGCWV